MNTEARVEIVNEEFGERQSWEISVSPTGRVVIDVLNGPVAEVTEAGAGHVCVALEPDAARALGRSLEAIADVANIAYRRRLAGGAS